MLYISEQFSQNVVLPQIAFPSFQYEHRFLLYLYSFGYFKGILMLNAHLKGFVCLLSSLSKCKLQLFNHPDQKPSGTTPFIVNNMKPLNLESSSSTNKPRLTLILFIVGRHQPTFTLSLAWPCLQGPHCISILSLNPSLGLPQMPHGHFASSSPP